MIPLIISHNFIKKKEEQRYAPIKSYCKVKEQLLLVITFMIKRCNQWENEVLYLILTEYLYDFFCNSRNDCSMLTMCIRDVRHSGESDAISCEAFSKPLTFWTIPNRKSYHNVVFTITLKTVRGYFIPTNIYEMNSRYQSLKKGTALF